MRNVTSTPLFQWNAPTEYPEVRILVRGWGELMKRLERRFTDGPIDWSKEHMMYQESKTMRQ